MKNQHAQYLGSLGGKMTASKMTKEQLTERAKKAVQARIAKKLSTVVSKDTSK